MRDCRQGHAAGCDEWPLHRYELTFGNHLTIASSVSPLSPTAIDWLLSRTVIRDYLGGVFHRYAQAPRRAAVLGLAQRAGSFWLKLWRARSVGCKQSPRRSLPLCQVELSSCDTSQSRTRWQSIYRTGVKEVAASAMFMSTSMSTLPGPCSQGSVSGSLVLCFTRLAGWRV